MNLIKKYTGSKKEIIHFKGEYVCHNCLPSVECGPISIKKVQQDIKFEPMLLVSNYNDNKKFFVGISC